MSKNYPAQVPFGERFDIQVSIQAYIETDHAFIETERIDGLDQAHLRFDIKVGKEHFNQYEPMSYFLIADGRHHGERTGLEWDALQRHWQKQYDYLKRNLGDAITLASLLLSGEAGISYRKDRDSDVLLVDADIEELEEWAKRHTQDNDESDASELDERDIFHPHHFVLLHAYNIWDRLKHLDEDEGEDEINIETFISGFRVGRYEEIEETISQYLRYANKWKTARRITKDHPRDEWAKLLKEVSGPGIFRFHYDLLDNLLETVPDKKFRHILRPKYRPWQIALVHLARDARLLDKDGSTLKANQWQSIRRALDKFCDARGKPRLKIRD